MQTNFVGAIHSELFEYFMVDDGFNIPQKLTQIEKTAKKIFDQLAPSLQKEIVRYIHNLKTEESRDRNVEKAIQFLHGKQRWIGRDRP